MITDKYHKYQKKYRVAHKEEWLKSRRDWYARVSTDPDWLAKRNRLVEAKRNHLRNMALLRYGGVCKCCKENRVMFLTLDHINGGGRTHRKVTGSGLSLYRWLAKNDYPKGLFQVMCWNCNCGRALNGGVCPHKGAIRGNSR